MANDDRLEKGLDRSAAMRGPTPAATFEMQLVAAFDEYIAESIENHRRGDGPSLRELGFTKVADVLGM